MRRLTILLLTGLIIKGGAGTATLPASRPLGPGVPLSSASYATYLPLITHKYVPNYVSPFGIDMYWDDNDSDGLPQMEAAGSAWLTLEFRWYEVEPTAPISGVHTYDWTTFDARIERAQSAGMTPFVEFGGNPAWAAQYAGGPVFNESDLLSVVTAAAERYNGATLGSPVVNDWSFYGEPDNGDVALASRGRGYWGNDPPGYADMLAGVSAAVHAVNPNAVVMIGGLAYDGFKPQGHFVKNFLDKVLYRLNANHGGAAATIGAVAFHFYPINTAVWPTIKEKAQYIRSVMAAHGAGNLPLVVPEMGYWSDTAIGSSEAQQARALVEMFVRGLSVGIKQMSWYTVFDNGPGTETSGLFRGIDLNQPKPAYTAYRNMTSELLGAHYHSPLSGTGIEGYVFDMSSGGQKSVVWAAGQSSAQATFHLSCIRRVDTMGNVTMPITDGSASDQDQILGQITLPVLQDQPIYVGGC